MARRVLWVFHLADLLLAVESKLLTRMRPEAYSFMEHFDLWFLTVKFSHSFSVMALKQVFPLVLLWLLYGLLAGMTKNLTSHLVDLYRPSIALNRLPRQRLGDLHQFREVIRRVSPALITQCGRSCSPTPGQRRLDPLYCCAASLAANGATLDCSQIDFDRVVDLNRCVARIGGFDAGARCVRWE